MNLFKIQVIFFTVLSLIYLGSGFILWRLENVRLRENQFRAFEEILEKRKRFLEDIIPDEVEKFPNYEKKQILIKYLLNIWLQQIARIITNPSADWKKQLNQLDLPFNGKLGIFVGRGARTIFQKGMDFKKLLGDDWADETFKAISGNGKAFNQFQKLYFMAISFEEFKSSQNSFQNLFHPETYLLRYYRDYGLFRMFLLLDLKQVNLADIQKQVYMDFLSRYGEYLTGGEDDFFEFEGKREKISESKLGFTYHAEHKEFIDYLFDRNIWNFSFFALLIYLVYLGGFKTFYLRFEIKVFVRYLIFVSLLFLSFRYFRIDIYEGQALQDARSAEESSEIACKKLDQGFKEFVNQLGRQIKEVFNQADFTIKNPIFQGGLTGLLMDPETRSELSDEQLADFSLPYLYRMTSSYAAALDPFVDKDFEKKAQSRRLSKNNFDPYLKVVKNVKDIYDLDRIKSNIPEWIGLSMERDDNYGRYLFNEGQLAKEAEFQSRWLNHKLLTSDQYFMGLHKVINEDYPTVLGATISGGNAFMKYLENRSINEEKGLSGKSVLMMAPNGKIFTYPKNLDLDREFFEGLWMRARLSSTGLVEVEVNGETHLASLNRSEIVKSFRYLILQKKHQVFEASDRLTNIFDQFQYWFLILSTFFGLWVGRSVVRPLENLREGFQKLKNKNYDFQLPVDGKDENARMIEAFNMMVSELDQKEKMMPFINATLEQVLGGQNERGKQPFVGNAVVVVSDIRSFTTLSSKTEPEELVTMLGEYFGFWQARVERNEGIIERFIGDAVVAVFFEKRSAHYAQQAIQCALEVQKDLYQWNLQRQAAGKFLVHNGIGLSLGEIAIDLVGTSQRTEFLSMGTPVDLAPVLEHLTKSGTSTKIFVDERVEYKLRDLYDFELRNSEDPEEKEAVDEPYYELIEEPFFSL
mgnify:CR=1 FL=1